MGTLVEQTPPTHMLDRQLRDPENSRIANLLWGAITGTILAMLIFGTTYVINVKDPPPGFNVGTARAFVDFVPWRWFGGIVLFVALVGFLFNTRLAYTWSDVIDWFR